MKVYVYYNLHKHIFSVRAESGVMKGKVIAHTNKICLVNVKFKVSEVGRQRVIDSGQKNVHAGVTGILCEDFVDSACSESIIYDPYKYESFVTKEGLKPVWKADKVIMMGKQVLALNPTGLVKIKLEK